jgi:prepilin-type N-terminal cleavage/methylation domain-containing protein
MKINIASKNTNRLQMNGFTLIEMIGVLAVIAILAALLIPKVTSAISDSRVNATVGTYQTVQAAAAGHYAKYNSFGLSTNGMILPAPTLTYDSTVLLPEGFLDQPFSVKSGNGAVVELVAGGGNAGNGYKLDGQNVGTTGNSYTVECVISNVVNQDAFDIAARVDGNLANTNTVGGSITGGKVVWTQTGTTGAGTMYMYVAGR